jgi:hypothetical protein
VYNPPPFRYERGAGSFLENYEQKDRFMAKPHRQLKKANHGARPANSKARRLKRGKVKT